jgi:molybdopterin converting factor small subunit
LTVTVKLMSRFAKYLEGNEEGKVDVPDGANVRTLSEQLGLPIKYVRIITVNGTQGDLDTGLSDGDDVCIFPPAIGGG